MEISDKYIIRLCEVVSVDDPNEGQRIKVFIPGVDEYEKIDNLTNTIRSEKLPYCFPLLPKMVHVVPKVGECVLILLEEIGGVKGQRYYIGPVISQDYMMNRDSFKTSAKSLMDGTQVLSPMPAPSMRPETEGSIPKIDDIALRGRNNADVVLKDNEVRMRVGFTKNENDIINSLDFNNNDLGYVQMKYGKYRDDKNKDYNSCVNIVADRINILSHDSPDKFALGDKNELITNTELSSIMEKAHKLPYGDLLVDFLKEFVRIFNAHTHPYAMLPPCLNSNDRGILATDLDKMLSNSVRIN